MKEQRNVGDNMDFDEIDYIAKILQAAENSNQIINKQRLSEFIRALSIVTEITKGTGIKVNYKMNETFKWMGSISMVSKCIGGINEEGFADAAKLASNVEFYPKIDGTVQCNLTFNGMTDLI